jgi:hypothetical protein
MEPRGAGLGRFFIKVVAIDFRSLDVTGGDSYLVVHHEFDQSATIHEYHALNGICEFDCLKGVSGRCNECLISISQKKQRLEN